MKTDSTKEISEDNRWDEMISKVQDITTFLNKYEFDYEKRNWASGEGYSLICDIDEEKEKLLSIDIYLNGRVGFSVITKKEVKEMRG